MIIEFSGIDGSGKTHQLERVMRWANEHGVACFERKLRSSSRRVLGGIAQSRGHRTWRDMYGSDEVELMTAVEMRQLVFEHVLPLSFPGQLIVTDTYVRTWVATALSWSAEIERLLPIYESIPPPDAAVHLEIEPGAAFERILARTKGDHVLRFGGRERLEQLSQAYDEVDSFLPYRASRISSTTSEVETFGHIRRLIAEAAKNAGDTSTAEAFQVEGTR